MEVQIMYEAKIQMNYMESVQDFVFGARKFDFDIDIEKGSIIYDAKSILGVICLGLGNVLKVKYNDRNEDFEALLNRYRVADAGAVL